MSYVTEASLFGFLMGGVRPAEPPAGSPFDKIVRLRDDKSEYWLASETVPHLGYKVWTHVPDLIERAKAHAKRLGMVVDEHFIPMCSTSPRGGRPFQDWELSRYAAYLVAQYADPRKPEVAACWTYFCWRIWQAEEAARQNARGGQARKVRAEQPLTTHGLIQQQLWALADAIGTLDHQEGAFGSINEVCTDLCEGQDLHAAKIEQLQTINKLQRCINADISARLRKLEVKQQQGEPVTPSTPSEAEDNRARNDVVRIIREYCSAKNIEKPNGVWRKMYAVLRKEIGFNAYDRLDSTKDRNKLDAIVRAGHIHRLEAIVRRILLPAILEDEEV